MKKILTILFSFITLILVPYIIGLLNSATDKILTEKGISYNKFLLLIFIIILVLIAIFIIGYLFFSFISKKINITKLSEVVSSYKYNGASLFSISNEEITQFSMISARKSLRIFYTFMELFGLYPVIYYNVTAKQYLNWIDYLYLKLLNDLNIQCGAKIIISLHVDESLLNEGLYDDRTKGLYLQLTKAAKAIILKVVPKAHIKDEYSYYLKAKNSMNDHPEYFIGTIISNINYFVKKISNNTINYNKFIRKESNILSVMPISVLSRKYRHLFVLDYIGSFDIWKLKPYDTLKQANNIIFIICNTIQNKAGERIPSWNELDGVNFTDSVNEIREKIKKNEKTINSALYEIYNGGNSDSLDEQVLQDACVDIILDIKRKLRL